MTGGESFGSGSGVGGSGSAVGNAGICPVCGVNQLNLTLHLSRHSKEEIIRSYMNGHPLPELANKRPPLGRLRRPSYSAVGSIGPTGISPRPTANQSPIFITGNSTPVNDPSLSGPLGPLPEAPPTPVHTVRLGSIAPIVQPPPRHNVPLAAAPLQHGAPANSYLLIGNNVFPPGSVIQNNLSLGNNGVSYLIPSSGGLMLATAAAPTTNQTILVPNPTSAAPTAPTPQSIPIKSTIPTPLPVTGPGSTIEDVYNGLNVPRRPPRSVVPDPLCIIGDNYSHHGQEDVFSSDHYRVEPSSNPNANSTRNFRPEEISNPNFSNDKPYRQEESSQPRDGDQTTVHIGKNISISLPKELAGKKDRLKEIIVQELVRVLLNNDNQEGGVSEASQPSTSMGKKKSLYASLLEPPKSETIIVENTFEETSTKLFQSQDQVDEENVNTEEEDPLASVSVPSSSKWKNGSDYHDLSNVNINPSVPSPVHDVTIDNGLEDGYSHTNSVSPYSIQVDEPMEVVFEDRGIANRLPSGATNFSSPANHSSATHREEKNFYDRASTSSSIKPPSHPAEYEGRQRKYSRRIEQISTNPRLDLASSSKAPIDLTPVTSTATNVSRNEVQEGVLNCEDDQLFLSTDRSFNTILGDSTLPEMVYVEDQVLGAVEEVFAGENSTSVLPSTGSNEISITASQKPNCSDDKKATFLSVYEEQCLTTTQGENFHEKLQEVKCKNEPLGSASSQPASSSSSSLSYSLKGKDSSSHSVNQVTITPSTSAVEPSSHFKGKVKVPNQEQDEELVDDPNIVDEFTGGGIFPDDQMFERELSNHQTEEVMSLKASETLADSDSERATPHEELSDLFYDRSCMFAGEPGPANLSPRNYPGIDSSAFHALTPALISHFDHPVQVDGGSHPPMTGFGSSPHDVVELSSGENMMHLSNDDCCTVLPAEGMMPPLFSSSHHESSSVSTSSYNSNIMGQAPPTSYAEDAKFTKQQVLLISTQGASINRQLSPIPSTSGLQAKLPAKALKEDEDYDFEYESDCYGDSDSDSGVANRGPLDLDPLKCSVCNKMFKSLKEKLLHAGQHSPCAEAMEKSGAIRRVGQIKVDHTSVTNFSMTSSLKDISSSTVLKCKEEAIVTSQEEPRAMLESCVSNGEYKCPECSLTYASADELLDHKKLVFKSRLACQICHLMFDKRSMKIKHMKSHSVEDLRCLLCNRNYPTRYAWSQHQFFHMGLVMYECKECARRFQRSSELKIHMRTHTGERPFSCASCSSAFTTRQALKRHLITHMDGQEVECDECQKTYKNSLCLNKHKMKAHSKGKVKNRARRDYMCSTCNEVFPSEKKLSWHREIHERWPKKCQQCGECFIHQSSLTKHIRQKHNPHHQTSDGKAENNATCHICLKVFRKSSLALHLRTHTGVKPYKCHICNRSFAVKCNLDAHRWVHMGVRDRPHKCKLCERSFHRKKDLEAHVRSHKNIRPFTCNECGKSFIHKNNLQLHVREHSGEKQHKCGNCGKAFFRKYNLNNHVRIHTGETPYECTICHKDFTQKSNYNVHMKAFHQERHAVHEEL